MFIAVLIFFFQAISLKVKAQDDSDLGYDTDKIVDIEIQGNRLILNDEILKSLDSYVGAPFDRRKVQGDLLNIYELGYFEKKDLEAKPFKSDEGVLLVYKLKENNPITAVEVYGNEAIDQIDVYSYFIDMLGKPENANLIADKLKELENDYALKGFIVARVADLELEKDGTLKVYVDEGLIKKIQYSGNKKTQETYLDHLMVNTKVDEAYNDQEFLKDYKKIQGTGYYSEIARNLVPDPSGDGYILNVDLTEKKTVTIGLGGGVNTRSGLFGNATMSWGNIKGKGESLSVNALNGSGFGSNNTFDSNTRLFRQRRIFNLTADYTVPYFRDSENTMRYNGSLTSGPNFLVDLAKQNRADLGFSLSKALTDNDFLNGGLSAGFISLKEDNDGDYIDFLGSAILDDQGFNISDKFSDNRTQNIKDVNKTVKNKAKATRIVDRARTEANKKRNGQLKDGLFSSFKASYVFNNLDNQSRPRKGWKNRVGLEPTASFGKFDSFVKSNLSATRYFPLPKDSAYVLHGRVGYDIFDNMPQFTQFRLGGVRGVRGYRPFSELGIGNRVGIASTEFRTPIYNVVPQMKKYKFTRGIDLALFADAGIIGGQDDLNDISDRLNRALSVGFGVRVNIPLVGAVRVDIGFPLVAALVDDSRLFRFNFSVAERY